MTDAEELTVPTVSDDIDETPAAETVDEQEEFVLPEPVDRVREARRELAAQLVEEAKAKG